MKNLFKKIRLWWANRRVQELDEAIGREFDTYWHIVEHLLAEKRKYDDVARKLRNEIYPSPRMMHGGYPYEH